MIELLQDIHTSYVPSIALFESWSALVAPIEKRNLIIKIVSESESADLNKQFRKKDAPTNVLSFEADSIPGFETNDLGSLAMCADLINHQANELSINPENHWAHLTIHGCLHLLGYDHQSDKQAAIMEKLEIDALSKLGFTNPYEYHDDK